MATGRQHAWIRDGEGMYVRDKGIDFDSEVQHVVLTKPSSTENFHVKTIQRSVLMMGRATE